MKVNPKKAFAKGSLSLTNKLGEKEGIIGEGITVKHLLEKDPIRLWQLIHSPNSQISLIKSTYFKLKEIIKKIAPELINENNKTSLKYKTLRKLAIEKHFGILGTDKSSFKSLGKSDFNKKP